MSPMKGCFWNFVLTIGGKRKITGTGRKFQKVSQPGPALYYVWTSDSLIQWPLGAGPNWFAFFSSNLYKFKIKIISS